MSKQLTKARAAVKKKNFEYAAELYTLHLKVQPGDLDARKELRAAARANKKLNGGSGLMAKMAAKKVEILAATIRVNKKDPEKTMIQCEDLLKQDPDAINALLRLGEAASYANLNDVATFAFEDALSLDNNNLEALRLLGRTYEGTDNLERALKCFQRLNKLDAKDSEAADKINKIPARITSKGYEEGSKKGFQGLIDQDEAKKLEVQNTRIRTPEQALERIESMLPALEEDPKDTKTMRLIAELYIKAEQLDEAIKMCERGVQADPGDVHIAELRGDLMLKKMEGMLKKLNAAHAKSPDDERIKAKLVQVTRQKGAFELEEFRRRAEANPTELGYRFPLAKALYDGGDIDGAIPEFQKAKGDQRSKTQAGFYLGQCYIKKKIFKLALKELDSAREELFEMDDTKKEITYLIARIYESAGKKEKAVAEYEAIVTADFNYKDVTTRMESLSDF